VVGYLAPGCVRLLQRHMTVRYLHDPSAGATKILSIFQLPEWLAIPHAMRALAAVPPVDS